MTSILKADNIQDADGNNIINESSNTITIGASGDTISIPSGATIANSGTATGFGEANTPHFKAFNNATFTFSQNTTTIMRMNTVAFESNSGSFSTSNYNFTVPSGQGGKYFFYSTIYCSSGGNNFNSTFMFFDKNNGTKLNEVYWDISSGSTTAFSNQASGVFDLSAGDIIKLQAYADISSGGTWNVNQNSLSASRCYFLGYKIGA